MPKTLNLYHVSQDENKEYDTYSDFVVSGYSEDEVKFIHPAGFVWHNNEWCYQDGRKSASSHSWTDPTNVKVKLIGIASEGINNFEIICSSFHAG